MDLIVTNALDRGLYTWFIDYTLPGFIIQRTYSWSLYLVLSPGVLSLNRGSLRTPKAHNIHQKPDKAPIFRGSLRSSGCI